MVLRDHCKHGVLRTYARLQYNRALAALHPEKMKSPNLNTRGAPCITPLKKRIKQTASGFSTHAFFPS